MMNILQNVQNIFFKYKRKLNVSTIRRTIATSPTNPDVNKIKLKLLFFGSDTFSLASLIRLNEIRKTTSVIIKLDVVTRGDFNPIRKYAKLNQLDYHKWPISAQSIKDHNYDVGVVVSFGHMISEDVINSFPFGMINVHGSLLPRWRGAAPIIYSMLNEDTVTGLTIMKIRPKHFDIGEILAQKEVQVPKNVLMPELYNTMANEGANLLIKCIQNLPDYLRNAKPQSDEGASYAPKVTDAMAHINWNTMNSKYIYNLYRAFYSFKHLTTMWQKRNIKIIEMDGCDNFAAKVNASRPGTVNYVRHENSLHVHCGDGSIVKILKLQVDNRKSFSARDFNNGYLKKVNENERYFE